LDDLSLVGVHDDGEHLLVAGPSGQRFRLRVDDALRAAVRRDRARLSQLQLESEGRLRPKEIQARIRAGETAREVAASAGLPIEHVQRYEGPVLAERQYIAEQAQQVRVQRGGVGGTLGDVVTERLTESEIDAEHVSWDAWRGEDGTWTVALGFDHGPQARQAHWTFNTTIRHVAPQDDDARWLSEEEPTEPASTPGQRRLASVRERVFDVEASGGISEEEAAAVELLDTLRERRGRRNRPLTEEEEIAGVADPVREAIDTLLGRSDPMHDPPASHPARSRSDRREPSREGRSREKRGNRDARATRESGGTRAERENDVVILPADPDRLDLDEAEGHDEAPVPAAAGRRNPANATAATPAGTPGAGGNRKPRRASVPSWDDIVFGQRRD
jgi:hypothetical protein